MVLAILLSGASRQESELLAYQCDLPVATIAKVRIWRKPASAGRLGTSAKGRRTNPLRGRRSGRGCGNNPDIALASEAVGSLI